MSRHPYAVYQAPDETRRVARAAFPNGTLCLHMANALGPIEDRRHYMCETRQSGQADCPS